MMMRMTMTRMMKTKAIFFVTLSCLLFTDCSTTPQKKSGDPARSLASSKTFELPACISDQDAERYMNDFKFSPADFTEGYDRCKDGTRSKQLLSAFWILDHGQFTVDPASDDRKDLLPIIIRSSYYDFLKSSIKGIVLDPVRFAAAGFDPSVTLAFMEQDPSSPDYHKVFIGGAFFSPTFSLIEVVSAVVHEARHAAGFDHQPCTEGDDRYFADNTEDCDPSYNWEGAYAVQLEFLWRVAKQGKNFPLAMRENAFQYFVKTWETSLNEHLNVQKKRLILADRNDGTLYTFDGKKLERNSSTRVGQALIFPKAYSAIIVMPLDRKKSAYFIDPYFGSNPPEFTQAPDLIGQLFNNYNSMDSQARADFLGAYTYPRYRAMVNQNQVSTLTMYGDDFEHMDASTFLPTKIVDRNPCGPQKQARDQLYLVNEAGKMVQIIVPGKGVKEPAHLAPIDCRWPSGVTAIEKIDAHTFQLTSEGILQENQNGSFQEVRSARGHRFSQMIRMDYYPSFRW